MIKNIALLVGLIIVTSLSLTGINILQKGIGGYDGRSMDDILGRPAAEATIDDLKNLSKKEVFQLFYAAPPPEFGELFGEYRAETLSVGIMAPAADFFTHHFFGPGRWVGKAFYPFEEEAGWGYNLFARTDGDTGRKRIHRTRRMDTAMGPSAINDGISFHLDYRSHNTGMVRSMRDEIRKINDRLYIGMGHMAAGGGAINPAPFVLYGERAPWQGLPE